VWVIVGSKMHRLLRRGFALLSTGEPKGCHPGEAPPSLHTFIAVRCPVAITVHAVWNRQIDQSEAGDGPNQH
jgi:hypothetical protein